MTTAYISHSDFLRHEMGSHHPECPERIQAIEDQLILSRVDGFLKRIEPPLATTEQVELVHSADHVEYVTGHSPTSGYFMLDGDTIMNPATLDRVIACRRCCHCRCRCGHERRS
jgi:acetoin utilization deacetylase AcuC-like enzyme